MNEKTSSGGIGFGGLLTLLFIGLKLGGAISWILLFAAVVAYCVRKL